MLLLKIDTSYQANLLDVTDVVENHSHSVSSDDGNVFLFYRRRHPYIRIRAGSNYVWFLPVKTSFTERFCDFFPCNADFYRLLLQFPNVREFLK